VAVPLVPIMIGILLRITGHGQLLLRSLALLALAIWAALDFWAWILPKKGCWKFVIGWTATSLLLIAVMGGIRWWFLDQLSDERKEVQQKLVANHSTPYGHDNDPMV
jgi:hypothetical protein